MNSWISRRPLLFAAAIMGMLEITLLLLLLAARWIAPEASLASLDLPLLLIQALIAAGLMSALGWWGAAGFNRPKAWRNLHLLLFPIALLVVPVFVVRPQFPALGQMAALLVVTLLIGFQEEAIFRGILIRGLQPLGVLRAVGISALLFGVIHANSFMFGRDPLFVTAQIVASVLGGFGLGALRIRINSIWPLIGLHAFNDFLQFVATNGLSAHEVPVWLPYTKIVIASMLALYGLYLLRGEWQRRTATAPLEQA
ncbi:MAG: CPBP family intramembrane metalloprotease [Caldilineaceae bacterium]|nr:CPBP family intramembrane metalloprotease [Caldilineaceae bacterium]